MYEILRLKAVKIVLNVFNLFDHHSDDDQIHQKLVVIFLKLFNFNLKI